MTRRAFRLPFGVLFIAAAVALTPLAAVAASPTQRPGPEENGNGANNHLHIPGEDADALRRFVEGRLYYLTPLPNLMFTRDVGIVVNDHMLLGRMAVPGRSREPLLFDFIYRYHERFKDVKRWTWADARVNDPTRQQ